MPQGSRIAHLRFARPGSRARATPRVCAYVAESFIESAGGRHVESKDAIDEVRDAAPLGNALNIQDIS